MRTARVHRALCLLAVAFLSVTGLAGIPSVSQARTGSVTNLAHLDFLLDTVSPGVVGGHTTYRIADQPELVMPWTYADARPGGAFARVGGGVLNPETGDYGQGAFNTDDITRAAVVYLRHWHQTGSRASRHKAYELLRSVAYMQTNSGPGAGHSVLWMQPDGELNPSADPPELPDPSDSGPSYWQARTLWALGEGYAAFEHADPRFARFLQDRLRLSLAALDREVLSKFGTYLTSDGRRLPAWLIINGADVTAEAMLGLSAYVEAAPEDRQARTTLSEFSLGIAKMAAGDAQSWPYGAILPWAESRSLWHAWSSQMSAALARSSRALGEPSLMRPAIKETVTFDPTLLTAGGSDNAWLPTPIDTTQIAYGADSRIQCLLAVADVGHLRSLRDVAAVAGAWFFGANKAGQPMYDPATGVTFDGVSSEGTINRNSGAESTIHGLLAMIALDAHPQVLARARSVAQVQERDGLTVVEGETAARTTGTVVVTDPAWTGESQYGAGRYLSLAGGQRASFDLGATLGPRLLEPVSWQEENGQARSRWTQGRTSLGVLRHSVGAQGVTATSGALLPQDLRRLVSRAGGSVTVTASRGTVRLDALIVRPLVSSMRLTGAGGSTELLHSASRQTIRVDAGTPGTVAQVRSYDAWGRLFFGARIVGRTGIPLKAGGVAVVES